MKPLQSHRSPNQVKSNIFLCSCQRETMAKNNILELKFESEKCKNFGFCMHDFLFQIDDQSNVSGYNAQQGAILKQKISSLCSLMWPKRKLISQRCLLKLTLEEQKSPNRGHRVPGDSSKVQIRQEGGLWLDRSHHEGSRPTSGMILEFACSSHTQNWFLQLLELCM